MARTKLKKYKKFKSSLFYNLSQIFISFLFYFLIFGVNTLHNDSNDDSIKEDSGLLTKEEKYKLDLEVDEREEKREKALLALDDDGYDCEVQIVEMIDRENLISDLLDLREETRNDLEDEMLFVQNNLDVDGSRLISLQEELFSLDIQIAESRLEVEVITNNLLSMESLYLDNGDINSLAEILRSEDEFSLIDNIKELEDRGRYFDALETINEKVNELDPENPSEKKGKYKAREEEDQDNSLSFNNLVGDSESDNENQDNE